jgi:MoxR-like ATPase
MNISTVKEVLTAMMNDKTPVTPFLWGRHGIGKSAAVHQAAKALGRRVLDIRISQKEAVDIAGMLYIYEDHELGMSVTSSHPPDWFANALAKGNVVVFFDEMNQGTKEVQNASFEIVLDRKLNNKPLPDSVFIVAAGNPEDDRYSTTR